MKIKVSDIEPLVDKYKGNIAAIARHFGVTRQTIYNHIARSPTLKDSIDDARQSMIDNAESMLYQQIGQGNTTAIIFFLKTQGKGRGYVERVENKDVGWQDEIIEALRRGELTPADVREAFPDLAENFFVKAGINAE